MISMPGSLPWEWMPISRPPGRSERTSGRHHLRGLEFDAGARPIGLRGDHQIIIGHHPARPRHDRIEQEGMILAPQGQDDGPRIDRIAGGRTDSRPPVLGQKSFELADLLGKAVRGIARQRDILPDQALRRGRRTRRQPRRLGVIEIGDDQHRGRMFEQPVGHLLQHQPHVLVADLLGHGVERHGGKARMQRPHHPRQHGAVADAGVEDPQRRRRRLQIAEFERNPVGDLGLLAAGRDEQQIFLPVVEEPEAGRHDIGRGGGAVDRLDGRSGVVRAAGGAARCSVR